MGAFDLFWHVMNLFAVATLFGVIAAGGARLLWRRRLQAVSWRRLVLATTAAATGCTLVGFIAFGRDGRMATYGLMVLAAAAVLAFVHRRRRL
ncbi:MAG: hypothetical protein IPI03_17365 [Rubrivivax sp.]|nr:hypothetical protein [Rubrivivax sp.]MBK7263528.1 hypothetical protein [Rubrivivax sp.]MBK8525636.1 hypothetical protein [Rubrivivax sp.]